MTYLTKRALVCGSTQGIGLAIAQKLSRDGFSVCLTARNQEKLNVALGSLDNSSGQTFPIQQD
jgi:3-oxoacyl-[acyl-carrier protein] reductase